LLDNFGVLSRNLKGFDVSPRLKASSIFWNTKDELPTVFEERKTPYVLLCFWNENKHTELQISLSRPCAFIFIFPAGVRIDRQIQVDKHTWIYKKNDGPYTRHKYIYIYIYIERERERERFLKIKNRKQSSLTIWLIILRRNEMEIWSIFDFIEKQWYMIGSI
jgi:hypothetical protein